MHRCPCAFEADHLGEASVLAGFSNSVLTIAAYRKAKLSRLSSLGELVGRYQKPFALGEVQADLP
jgi:hypothetical protein